MPRKALARFFERLVVASLPLAVPACGGSRASTMTTTPDLAVPAETDGGGDDLDMGMAAKPSDLSKVLTGDLARADMYDPCEVSLDPPPAVVPFPAGDIPDGGFAMTCEAAAFCNKYCPDIRYTTCCGPDKVDGGYELSCILDCNAGPGPGRRPEGLAPSTATGACAVGRYFADAAHLEAASVHAFRRLARELTAHGAPSSLVADAKRRCATRFVTRG